MVDSIIAHLLMKRRPQLSDTNPFEQYVAQMKQNLRVYVKQLESHDASQ